MPYVHPFSHPSQRVELTVWSELHFLWIYFTIVSSEQYSYSWLLKNHLLSILLGFISLGTVSVSLGHKKLPPTVFVRCENCYLEMKSKRGLVQERVWQYLFFHEGKRPKIFVCAANRVRWWCYSDHLMARIDLILILNLWVVSRGTRKLAGRLGMFFFWLFLPLFLVCVM